MSTEPTKFRMTAVRCVSMNSSVLAVHASGIHTVSKTALPSITLVDGFGVEGDAHSGATVKHLSRVRRDATQPNLRQIHLIHSELLDELREKGFDVEPGMMGENITTAGIDLLSLPTGVRGVGLIQGIEFVKDRETKKHFDPSVGVNAMLTEELRKRGVWIRVPAYILPLVPPLTITADETDNLTKIIDEALGAVEARLGV